MRLFLTFLFLFNLNAPLAFAQSDEAMKFTLGDTIIAKGKINSDTADHFRAFLKSNNKHGQSWNKTIKLTSNGGNLSAGLELGRLIRQHHMSIVAEDICASSCVFVMMGGVNRYIAENTKIGVHQFYLPSAISDPTKQQFTGEDLITQQRLIGRLQDYTVDMGVDTGVLALASKTDPRAITILVYDQLKAFKLITTLTTLPIKTISAPTIKLAPANNQEFIKITNDIEKARDYLQQTQSARLAGSCRSNGAIVKFIKNRGQPNAIAEGMYDESSAVEECGRQSLRDDESNIADYKKCLSNYSKNTIRLSANCHKGDFVTHYSNGYISRLKIAFPRNIPYDENLTYSFGDKALRIKDLKTNEWLNNSCASALEFEAQRYLALCDTTPSGNAQWSKFERK